PAEAIPALRPLADSRRSSSRARPCTGWPGYLSKAVSTANQSGVITSRPGAIAGYRISRDQSAPYSIRLWPTRDPFMRFDLIEVGRDPRFQALAERRRLLEKCASRGRDSCCEQFDEDGPLVFEHACQFGCEAIVSKRNNSHSRSDRLPRLGQDQETGANGQARSGRG